MRFRRAIFVLLIIVAVVAGLGGAIWRRYYPKAIQDSRWLMGTLVEIRIFGSPQALEGAFDRIEALDEAMSRTKPGSDVYRVNEGAGVQWVPVGHDTFHVIGKGMEFAKLTHGLFDPSIGPLVELWGIGTENAHVPPRADIWEALGLIDYSRILFNKEKAEVKLKDPGMALDLGGIAKGYAADAAAAFLRNAGVNSAFINLGGNVYVVGAKPDGTPWRIGIQDPESTRGTHLAILEVEDTSIVTSGPYERNFWQDGVRYHHILDPRTGYPGESGLLSVTIVSPSSMAADALATGVFVLGREKGMALLENTDNVEGILVTDSHEIYVTGGLKGRLLSVAKGFDIRE